MRKVIFYKDKITATQWEENNRIWVEFDIASQGKPLNHYFNRIVEIHPDVTVEDFVRHLEKYEDVINYCFADYSKDIPLKLFLNEMDQAGEVSDLEDVELYWEGEVVNGDLAIIGYLRGWLKEEKVKEIGEEYDVPHDINFLPLNSWKNCRFVLNENLPLINAGEIHEVKSELICQVFYRWTLFEVISNFLAEITLNGTPEEREAILAQIQNRKFDIKEVVKDKEKTRFWLDFLTTELDELKALKEEALDEEDYEKAGKIKEDIEYVEGELKKLQTEVDKYNENGTK